ncbi:hypothetical protein KY328_04955 [Candidatus Woesearchaeota archaeon]|nr:hypothetical protein [Candidatus Woesearchaeota archaeon]MBW3022248.1 hypothetical protein [Candidatus Woesearchaeota archaeon]
MFEYDSFVGWLQRKLVRDDLIRQNFLRIQEADNRSCGPDVLNLDNVVYAVGSSYKTKTSD